MATRLYFTSIGQPTRTLPTVDSSWERTTGFIRRLFHSTKEGTVHANFALSKGVATNPADVLMYQFISRPLGAQTISGTVKGIIQSIASDANTARAQLLIRVFDHTLATLRGTILAHDGSALSNDFPTAAYTNRKFPLNWSGSGTSLSSLAVLDGDLLVVEIGARMYTAATAITFGLRLGDNSALSDLAENETDTADGVPWLEFSQNLIFMENASNDSIFHAGGSFDPAIVSVSTSGGSRLLSRGTSFFPAISNYRVNQFGTGAGVNGGGGGLPTLPIGTVRYYQMRAATASPGIFVTWINNTGDDTNRPMSAVGTSQISLIWDV